MRRSSTYNLTYAAENRLESVTANGETTEFVYDGYGQRVKATFGSATTVYVGNHYEKQGSTVRTYDYAGGQRVAMNHGGVVYYLHSDHLGSTGLATDGSGALLAAQRYFPYGEIRYAIGVLPTDFGFTGQRNEGTIGLYDYRARYYAPTLGRFVSADTIVPEAGNPQSLNRYSYVLNDPLKYVDPSGHFEWLPFALVLGAAYIGGRVSYELGTLIIPGADQMRRDQIGGGLVTDLSDVIEREAAPHSVDQTLVGAVLRHESAAFERRLLTIWPSMQPGLIANTAEFIQRELQGDTASIGPGQMQLRRARELEEMGYVTARKNDFERRQALLGNETSVEYVAGMLQYLSDQLSSMPDFSGLSTEDQQRMTLIAYNWGWTEALQNAIAEKGFEWLIHNYHYDNETFDEYLRWSTGE
ncbi:MAG: RHS repeat-associated core domain-containing protein [Chloroflexota bacterium]|nr:RHS repeat-associated core domain-containing protein [Chloroflexota bacterium]